MAVAKNVSAAKPKTGGAVYRGAVGTALPTDAKTALNAAFKALGFCSEDGLTNSNSPTSTKVKAWGGETVLVTQTEKPDTFKFKLLEVLNDEVLKAAYGDANVTGAVATGLTVKANVAQQNSASWVFDMVMRDGVLKRIVVPSATVSAIADIVYKDSEPVGYEITLDAVPDASGNTHYEYIVNGTAD